MMFSKFSILKALSCLFAMFFNKSQSPFKRFGRLLNKEASEPVGAEDIVILEGYGCLAVPLCEGGTSFERFQD